MEGSPKNDDVPPPVELAPVSELHVPAETPEDVIAALEALLRNDYASSIDEHLVDADPEYAARMRAGWPTDIVRHLRRLIARVASGASFAIEAAVAPSVETVAGAAWAFGGTKAAIVFARELGNEIESAADNASEWDAPAFQRVFADALPYATGNRVVFRLGSVIEDLDGHPGWMCALTLTELV